MNASGSMGGGGGGGLSRSDRSHQLENLGGLQKLLDKGSDNGQDNDLT